MKFENACNCIVDYSILEKAIKEECSRRNITPKDEYKIYLYRGYAGISIKHDKVSVHRIIGKYIVGFNFDSEIHVHHIDGNKCSYNANDTAWEVGKGIPNEELIIHTLEGDMIASRNDYIIKGIKGEVCPCKPDIFEKTYEEVGGMNVLEKILEEIKEKCVELSKSHWGDDECHLVGKGIQSMYIQTEKIIRFHMDDVTDTNIPSNDGWIPVEDGLPEGGEKVLVWYEYFRYGEYNRMFQTHGIGWQYDGHWSGDVSGTKARCIAWRPLPEPYKPKKLQTEEKPVQ
jgi:hypothetical protein|nr:MAG TPA: Protein of unknown function (DUF551) [Caudoviricetes sp.]